MGAKSLKDFRFQEAIYVAKPFLPDKQQFCKGLDEIWETHQLTNDGPLVNRFATELSSYCGHSDNLSLFNNGTLALQIGLQALGVSGEVITTPFSFVATTHALYWNKIKPVFCDIESDFYTLDPVRVEEAITPWTTAILAVHVFGNPCNLEALADIANKNNIALIYDAAHAFGVKVNGCSIADYGDLSMFSFHATKLFHSMEGGMLTYRHARLKSEVNYLRNFGFKNQTEVVMPGTNAKMNEMQALMGLEVLKHLPGLIEKREIISNVYRSRLAGVKGVRLPALARPGVESNYAYFPVEIIESEYGMSRDQLHQELKQHNLFTRRYFYPLICDFACYQSLPITEPLDVARGVASRILTLPIYYDLALETVEEICNLLEYKQSQ